MALAWQYWKNKATQSELLAHINSCDSNFISGLMKRTDLLAYTIKMLSFAERFEAWHEEQLIGMVVIYCNDLLSHQAFITHVSTLPQWQGKGIARQLLADACQYAKAFGMTSVVLEVAEDNVIALKMYQNYGFSLDTQTTKCSYHLRLIL